MAELGLVSQLSSNLAPPHLPPHRPSDVSGKQTKHKRGTLWILIWDWICYFTYSFQNLHIQFFHS